MRRKAIVAVGVLCLVVAPSLLVAQVASFSGCYDVEMGPWLPEGSLASDSQYLRTPPRIHLDTIHPGPWQMRIGPEAFALRPAPGSLPSIHKYAGWEPLAADTVQLMWTNGFSGMRVRLARTELGLEGTARSFWDFDRKLQTSTFAAHPVGCADPLPDAWVATWDAPRGFPLASGDSLLLDELLPPSVTTDVPLQAAVLLDVVPSGLMSGVTTVAVSLDFDRRVGKIWVTYPGNFDAADLEREFTARWGPPTTSTTVLRGQERNSRP